MKLLESFILKYFKFLVPKTGKSTHILFAVQGYNSVYCIRGSIISVSTTSETLVRKGWVTVFMTNSNLIEDIDVPTGLRRTY